VGEVPARSIDKVDFDRLPSNFPKTEQGNKRLYFEIALLRVDWNRKEKDPKLGFKASKEDLVNYYKLLLEEMKRRGLKPPKKRHRLDELARNIGKGYIRQYNHFTDSEQVFRIMKEVHLAWGWKEADLGTGAFRKHSLVYKENNKIEGFILASINHVFKIGVDPEKQGKGIGTSLMRQYLSTAQKVTLVVNEVNTKAQDFYQSIGFKKKALVRYSYYEPTGVGIVYAWDSGKITKKVGTFTPPNKPAWRIFKPEEVFSLSDFDLPYLVDIKMDGMRIQTHIGDTIHLYSEDEGFEKKNRLKIAASELKAKYPKGTVVDIEGLMLKNGKPLHRTSFIGYVNGKDYNKEKDNNCQLWVFDVLEYKGEDLRDKPLSERLEYLKKLPDTEHVKVNKESKKYWVVKDKKQALAAISRARKVPGSEGAMIKTLSSKLERGKKADNKGWAKLKNLKEVDCIVVDKEHPKESKTGKPIVGTWNYHVAAGPYEGKCGTLVKKLVPKNVVEIKGKVYAYLGKTFSTSINAPKGEIIRIWSPEINKYPVMTKEGKETGCFYYGVFQPRVMEHVKERNIPDSLNVLNNLAKATLPRKGLIEKDWCEGKGGKWITVEGKHICISEDKKIARDFYERTLLTPDHKVKLTYHESKKEMADYATSTYNSLPIKFKGEIKSIHLSNKRRTFEDVYAGRIPEDFTEYKNDFVGGTWTLESKNITMYDKGSKESFLHELGHAIEPTLGDVGSEISGKWTRVWAKERVSQYAKKNRFEGFAEAFKRYKTEPQLVKAGYPETYKFMEEYLSGE